MYANNGGYGKILTPGRYRVVFGAPIIIHIFFCFVFEEYYNSYLGSCKINLKIFDT